MVNTLDFGDEKSLNADFDEQMQGLVNEAQAISEKRKQEGSPASLAEISRLVAEQSKTLERLAATVESQSQKSDAIVELRDGVSRKMALNQQLFDTLHAELKAYRDQTLLEISQRPLILDVIGVYDELRTLFSQIEVVAENAPSGSPLERINVMADHLLHHVLEVLERVGVTKREPLTGKYDKNSQRAVSRLATTNREEDGVVERSVKSGFDWRGRVVRPEEIVVKKWAEMAVSGDEISENETSKQKGESL